MSGLEVVVALLIVVGVVGVVVPVLPGGLLVVGAILLWAVVESSVAGWVVLAIAAACVLVGAVVKYVVPGRRLEQAGIPRSTMLVGGLLGIVGFFAVPVVGLFLGFALGVYLAELRRVGSTAAGPATRRAVAAAGLSMLIELLATLLAAATWVGGLVAT